MALKALGPIGAALSAHALSEDLAKKDYASGAAGTVAGGLEAFALASTALGAGGTATAGAATGGLALAGGGGAAVAASVEAPIVGAFGVGVVVRTAIEKGLDVSEYAFKHGIEAQEFAKSLGAGETASFVAGAMARLRSCQPPLPADKPRPWVPGGVTA
jgi:hypothetical protein